MQVIDLPQAPAPPLPPELVFQSGPPEGVLVATVLIVGLIVAGVVFGPLIRAFARRIEGKSIDPGLAAEVEQLRARVSDLEEVSHRVAELEERVDFSERLLTQGREQPVIKGQA
jgi:hypothetical protein